MSKGIFITGTGTDVGKTFVTALLVKAMRENGLNCAYYKAAISGADSIAESDAGYVNKVADIKQDESTLLSYVYKTPVSPHLASKIEGNPVCLDKVFNDYRKVCGKYDYVAVEGSGGIICPIRWDDERILLEDVVRRLSLDTLVVADAGLGTINSTVLTCEYLKSKDFKVKGIILNNYDDSTMQRDNVEMIEELTGISVVATVEKNADKIEISKEKLGKIF